MSYKVTHIESYYKIALAVPDESGTFYMVDKQGNQVLDKQGNPIEVKTQL